MIALILAFTVAASFGLGILYTRARWEAEQLRRLRQLELIRRAVIDNAKSE